MRRAQIERKNGAPCSAPRRPCRTCWRSATAPRAQLADAQRNLERQAELFTARAVGSQTALDTARTQTEVQKAALASAEAQIASARAELDGLDADIALAEANCNPPRP